jgi:hypothetical protein
VVVVLDPGRVEAAHEEAALARVALVEPLRVRAVEEVHAGGHALAGRVDQQVEVVLHRADRVDLPVEAERGEGQEAAEVLVVERRLEQVLAPGRVGGDVIDPVGE